MISYLSMYAYIIYLAASCLSRYAFVSGARDADGTPNVSGYGWSLRYELELNLTLQSCTSAPAAATTYGRLATSTSIDYASSAANATDNDFRVDMVAALKKWCNPDPVGDKGSCKGLPSGHFMDAKKHEYANWKTIHECKAREPLGGCAALTGSDLCEYPSTKPGCPSNALSDTGCLRRERHDQICKHTANCAAAAACTPGPGSYDDCDTKDCIWKQKSQCIATIPDNCGQTNTDLSTTNKVDNEDFYATCAGKATSSDCNAVANGRCIYEPMQYPPWIINGSSDNATKTTSDD